MKTKILKEDSEIAKAHEKLLKFMNNDIDLMISIYGTSLACAKTLGEFILENFEIKNLSPEIKYFLAVIWNLYAQIYCPEEMIKRQFDMDFQNYFESGGIDDKFAMIVKQLYDICKELKLL